MSAECACAGKLHGYGFVQFQTQEAAEKACQLHGSDFMGRELTVDVATAADGGKAPTGTPVEGCWFCLSNPNADVNLVASIGAPLCHATSAPNHHTPTCLVNGDHAEFPTALKQGMSTHQGSGWLAIEGV